MRNLNFTPMKVETRTKSMIMSHYVKHGHQITMMNAEGEKDIRLSFI